MFSVPLQFNCPVQMDESVHDHVEQDTETRVGVNKVRFSSITTEYYVTTTKKKDREEPCWELFLNWFKGLCCFTDTSENTGKIRKGVSRQDSTETFDGGSFSSSDGG
jgi:hypothetical protein